MEAALGAQMQQDIDSHVQGAPGGPMLQQQPPHVQPQAPEAGMSPQAMMQTMMQQFMQQFMQTMMQAMPQAAAGTA